MTGRHYRWHRAWRVDLEAHTATHDCGLVVRFARARDAAAWDGAADPAHAADVLTRLTAEHGAHNAPQRLARLMREAGDAWTHAVDNARRIASR